jgi:hypothetical protein
MTNPDAPAFSSSWEPKDYADKYPEVIPKEVVCMGLTKREYFAAMAMQGVIQMTGGPIGWDTPDLAAKFIVEWVDALIAELSK